MYKNFNEIPTLTQIYVFLIGLWTTFINFFKREDIKQASISKKIIAFITDLITSVGFTIITFLTLTGYGLNEVFSVGIAGFLGHQGARAAYLIELVILEKVGARKTYEKRVKDG